MSPLPRSLLPERIRAAVRSAPRQAFEWIGSDRYSRFGLDGLDMRLDRRWVKLHHLYRAMAWLGEELPEAEQDARTPFAPRCTKDLVEERLFAHRRDLFSRLDLVFMDTTSLYLGLSG